MRLYLFLHHIFFSFFYYLIYLLILFTLNLYSHLIQRSRGLSYNKDIKISESIYKSQIGIVIREL